VALDSTEFSAHGLDVFFCGHAQGGHGAFDDGTFHRLEIRFGRLVHWSRYPVLESGVLVALVQGDEERPVLRTLEESLPIVGAVGEC
jgi:hypothetical protein